MDFEGMVEDGVLIEAINCLRLGKSQKEMGVNDCLNHTFSYLLAKKMYYENLMEMFREEFLG